MFKSAVRTADGGGIEHWSTQVSPEKAAAVVHAACDGKSWTLYEAGDTVPDEHKVTEAEKAEPAKSHAAPARAPSKKKR